MRALKIDVEMRPTKDGHKVLIRWGESYARLASSEPAYFKAVQRDVNENDVTTFDLPKRANVLVLFQKKTATGPDKISALGFFPSVEDPQQDSLQHVKAIPTLEQMAMVGWRPFSYAHGNIRVQGESGAIYSTDYPSAQGKIQSELYRVHNDTMLLKYICGVIDEDELASQAATAVRAPKKTRDIERDVQMQQLHERLNKANRYVHKAYELLSEEPLLLAFVPERRKDRKIMLERFREYCQIHPIPAEGSNVVIFPETEETKTDQANEA